MALSHGEGAAAAQAAPPGGPPGVSAPAPTSPAHKRALPDYDGRPEATRVGDALLWVPRVVLFPAYLVSETLIRRPLGYLVSAAEKGNWIEEVKNIFTFGPNHNIGVVPTGLVDFGFRPSVGVYFFYDDLGFTKNEFRVHAATGGVDWLRLTVADRIPLDDRAYLKLRGEGSTRPDWLFAGIGPRSLERDIARYRAKSVEGGATLHVDFGGANTVDAYTSVRSTAFSDVCCRRTVGELVRAGRYPLPPGFDTGVTAYHLGAKLGLDSRRPRPAPGHGARLELFGEHAVDLRRPLENRWVRYGGSLGGYIDLTGQSRVLGLIVSTELVDPLGPGEVPFIELATLGGDALMRGFWPGRLRGRSSASATLEYRYPIWAFLDGAAQIAVGNVFSGRLRDFDPDLLRLSFLLGLRTNTSRDHSFDVLIGSGTETFAQGAGLQEVRFLFGATRGF